MKVNFRDTWKAAIIDIDKIKYYEYNIFDTLKENLQHILVIKYNLLNRFLIQL